MLGLLLEKVEKQAFKGIGPLDIGPSSSDSTNSRWARAHRGEAVDDLAPHRGPVAVAMGGKGTPVTAKRPSPRQGVYPKGSSADLVGQ